MVNLIYANVFFEHESHESDESCKFAALALSRVRYWCLGRTKGIIDGLWCEGKCERRKFTLTLTLTTETPINRAFQAKCESERVNKEEKLYY